MQRRHISLNVRASIKIKLLTRTDMIPGPALKEESAVLNAVIFPLMLLMSFSTSLIVAPWQYVAIMVRAKMAENTFIV